MLLHDHYNPTTATGGDAAAVAVGGIAAADTTIGAAAEAVTAVTAGDATLGAFGATAVVTAPEVAVTEEVPLLLLPLLALPLVPTPPPPPSFLGVQVLRRCSFAGLSGGCRELRIYGTTISL